MFRVANDFKKALTKERTCSASYSSPMQTPMTETTTCPAKCDGGYPGGRYLHYLSTGARRSYKDEKAWREKHTDHWQVDNGMNACVSYTLELKNGAGSSDMSKGTCEMTTEENCKVALGAKGKMRLHRGIACSAALVAHEAQRADAVALAAKAATALAEKAKADAAKAKADTAVKAKAAAAKKAEDALRAAEVAGKKPSHDELVAVNTTEKALAVAREEDASADAAAGAATATATAATAASAGDSKTPSLDEDKAVNNGTSAAVEKAASAASEKAKIGVAAQGITTNDKEVAKAAKVKAGEAVKVKAAAAKKAEDAVLAAEVAGKTPSHDELVAVNATEKALAVAREDDAEAARNEEHAAARSKRADAAKDKWDSHANWARQDTQEEANAKIRKSLIVGSTELAATVDREVVADKKELPGFPGLAMEEVEGEVRFDTSKGVDFAASDVTDAMLTTFQTTLAASLPSTTPADVRMWAMEGGGGGSPSPRRTRRTLGTTAATPPPPATARLRNSKRSGGTGNRHSRLPRPRPRCRR